MLNFSPVASPELEPEADCINKEDLKQRLSRLLLTCDNERLELAERTEESSEPEQCGVERGETLSRSRLVRQDAVQRWAVYLVMRVGFPTELNPSPSCCTSYFLPISVR